MAKAVKVTKKPGKSVGQKPKKKKVDVMIAMPMGGMGMGMGPGMSPGGPVGRARRRPRY